ncbi:hypothetical protein NMG60_11002535 [Bertholletia excelsa]
MPKSEIKPKSTRKPLRDVSNGTEFAKSLKKKAPVKDERVEDGVLDRLLLVHSDLSSLIHQIDELVVQALKVTSKKGLNEIESFTQTLSEIQSSLQLWAPRLQKALSSPSSCSENQFRRSLISTVSPTKECTRDLIRSPDQTKFDSLISPSPLVSWRADCTIEGGKQLFLLTPLPKAKEFLTKPQDSSNLEIEDIASNTTFLPKCLNAISGGTNHNVLEDGALKPTSSKVFNSVVSDRERTPEAKHISSSNFPKIDCSVLVMTPCLKMSPPRTCVLLEPISEVLKKGNHGVKKSTPYPFRVKELSGSEVSESSSSDRSENLALKYPELCGIQAPLKLVNGREEVDTSPDWLISPPKTCVLMEPPDEKPMQAPNNGQLPQTACVGNQKTNISLPKGNEVQTNQGVTSKSHNQELGGMSAMIDSTPLWKEPESVFRTGKRPGENTLKKELWTKFEAASTHGLSFNVSILQGRKGFLDRLDEVSCDDTPPVPKSLR